MATFYEHFERIKNKNNQLGFAIRENYEYLSYKGKTRIIHDFIKAIGFNYCYDHFKYSLVTCEDSRDQIDHVMFVYFFNENREEIAYISLDLFPLVGMVVRENPITWSDEFYNKLELTPRILI